MIKRPLTDSERAHVGKHYNPRFGGVFPVPFTSIEDTPRLCVSINEQWFPHIVGALDVLNQPDAWTGADEQIEDARAQIRALIANAAYCEDDIVSIIDMRIVDCSMEVQYSNAPGTWVYVGTFGNCGGGGGSDYEFPPISIEFEIEVYDRMENLEDVYDSDPANFRPELNTWDSNLDAALCLAIRAFVEASCETLIARVNGERDKKLLAGIAGGFIGLAIVAFAPPLYAYTLGTAIGFGALGVATNAAMSDNEKINALRDSQVRECVTQLIYAGLMGAKPTVTAWEQAATGYTFPGEDANFVQNVVSDLMQGVKTFVSFVDMLAEMKTSADAGLIGNDCNGDYSACTSWVHTVYAPDFAAFGTVSDGVYNAVELAWEPAETGAVTEVVSLDVSVASGPSTSITGIEMMTRRVGSFTNRSSIDINSDRVYLGLPSTAQDWVGNDSISPEKTGVTNLLFRAAKDGDSASANIFLYGVRIYGNGQNPFS